MYELTAEELESVKEYRLLLIKAGLTKQQLEGATCYRILSVLSGDPDWLSKNDIHTKLSTEIKNKKNKIESLEYDLRRLQNRKDELKKEYDSLYKKYEKTIEFIGEYVEKFNELLLECESEEQRSCLKAAQFFINNINVDTKYDNTAYIVGLASIISGNGMDAVTELKKINKDLFLNTNKLKSKYKEITLAKLMGDDDDDDLGDF